MMTNDSTPRTVVAVNRGVELSEHVDLKPEDEYRLLDVLIGRWINEGQTAQSTDSPPMTILTSDVYEWAPGGCFVLHSAYGRIGTIDVGGIEIIGYDAPSRQYQSTFYDSQGNISTGTLTVKGGVWRWQGETTRCTAVFSDDGKTQTAHHERSDDGVTWVPSMNVTLTKVE